MGAPKVTAGDRTGAEAGYRFFVEATGTYNNQLVPVATDQNGENIQSGAVFGGDIRVGLYGVKRFRHAEVGINYLGGYRKYTGSYDRLSGPEQTLQIDTALELSRRWTWNTSTQGGIFTRPFGAFTSYGGYGLGSLNNISPGTEIFDNRTYYAAQVQTATYQKSARTAFTFGGNAFTVRRAGSVLVGVDGYGAQGAIIHQLTRRTSIGATYDYLKYDYPGQYGNATAHQVMLTYTTQISRRWSLSLAGGAFYAEVEGLTNVEVDPAIAALFGTTVATETFYRRRVLPAAQAHFTGDYGHHSYAFSYDRKVNPGNGVYLTSAHETAGVQYSYTGIRRWNFGLGGGWTRMASIGQRLTPIQYGHVGGGVSYRFAGPVSLTARLDQRKSLINEPGGLRVNGTIATVGFAFSPGERPLSLW